MKFKEFLEKGIQKLKKLEPGILVGMGEVLNEKTKP